MGPSVRIPRVVTALYIFTVVNLTALLNITLVEANIKVLDNRNATQQKMIDRMARFGGSFSSSGLWGRINETTPPNACSKVAHAPSDTGNWIALIRRSGCDFDLKVYHAQEAGYNAAVVYDPDSNTLVAMAGDTAREVNIPAVFIGADNAYLLRENYTDKLGFTVVIDDSFPVLNPNMYLLPFAIVVGICFLLMLAFMIAKWVHDIRKKRKSRLSKQSLKKIPIKKFKKGDNYDVCAICLDEYEEGEKLRILPCAHAYHQVCVDPWLTKNKRVCPLCKKRVIPGDETDSDSDSDSDGSLEGAAGGENTPLLSATDGPARQDTTFQSSGLPAMLRSEVECFTDSDSDDTSGPDSLTYSTYQSSVDIHQPSLQRSSINADPTTILQSRPSPSEMLSVASSGSSRYGSLSSSNLLLQPADDQSNLWVRPADDQMVVGMDNLAVDIMEDYYHSTSPDTRYHSTSPDTHVSLSAAEEATEVTGDDDDYTVQADQPQRERRRSYEEIV